MSFKKGFEKSAFIAPLARLAGSAVMGGAKMLGRGAARVGSGNLTRKLTGMDKATALLTAGGAAADYSDISDKMRRAAQR